MSKGSIAWLCSLPGELKGFKAHPGRRRPQWSCTASEHSGLARELSYPPFHVDLHHSSPRASKLWSKGLDPGPNLSPGVLSPVYTTPRQQCLTTSES